MRRKRITWALALWMAFLSTATVAPGVSAALQDGASGPTAAICSLGLAGEDGAQSTTLLCPLCGSGLPHALPAHAQACNVRPQGDVAATPAAQAQPPIAFQARPPPARAPPLIPVIS